jgi:hypothetical protein
MSNKKLYYTKNPLKLGALRGKAKKVTTSVTFGNW